MSVRDLDGINIPGSADEECCWNEQGIMGDRTCPELPGFIHCHNCPVYTGAALRLFDRAMPEDYREQWTQEIARQKEEAAPQSLSLVAFRVRGEWLALSTSVVVEIIEPGAVHSIPHRSDRILRGLVNIHGGLQLCFSLKDLLDIDDAAGNENRDAQKVFERMVLIKWQKSGWVFAADEVYGILHFEHGAVGPPPETLRQSRAAFSQGVLTWRGRTIGWLDHELLLSALERHIR